jgi:hypothetical protein
MMQAGARIPSAPVSNRAICQGMCTLLISQLTPKQRCTKIVTLRGLCGTAFTRIIAYENNNSQNQYGYTISVAIVTFKALPRSAADHYRLGEQRPRMRAFEIYQEIKKTWK